MEPQPLLQECHLDRNVAPGRNEMMLIMKIKYIIWTRRNAGIVIEAPAEKVGRGYKVHEQTAKITGTGKVILHEQDVIVYDCSVIEVIDD